MAAYVILLVLGSFVGVFLVSWATRGRRRRDLHED
jgi:hypothetical protein